MENFEKDTTFLEIYIKGLSNWLYDKKECVLESIESFVKKFWKLVWYSETLFIAAKW